MDAATLKALELSAYAVQVPPGAESSQLPRASQALLESLDRELWPMRQVSDVFAVLHELANPAYADFPAHVHALLSVMRQSEVAWPVRDYCSDLMIAVGAQWRGVQAELLEAIDDEEMPWGYRLVLTGCCGAEGADRLRGMLARTRFDETRLRARVQQTILRFDSTLDVTSLLDALYDGLRWDARASMIMEMPSQRRDVAPWVARQMDGAPGGLRAVAASWLIEVWWRGDPEIEAALAACVASPDVEDDERARIARALANHATRASLEALATALSETSSRDLRYACGLAIRAIDDRHPVMPGAQGALSVALEEQVQGALTQTSAAGQGDLTDAARASELAVREADGALANLDPLAQVASRWDRIGAGPRKLPLAVRVRTYVNQGAFHWVLWAGLALLNLLMLLVGVGDAEAMFVLTLMASFYIHGPLFLVLLVLGFLSSDAATLRNGRPVIATLTARVGRTSHWRLELPDGNREFTLKNAPEGDTLPVLSHGNKTLPITRFTRFASLDHHGAFTTPTGLDRYAWAIPLFTILSYATIIAWGLAAISL
jgi:hypothetical protein